MINLDNKSGSFTKCVFLLFSFGFWHLRVHQVHLYNFSSPYLAKSKKDNLRDHFGTTLSPFVGPLWGHFDTMLGPLLGPLWGHFGATLGPLWDHFWGHFGATLGRRLGPLWMHFVATFGATLGQFLKPFLMLILGPVRGPLVGATLGHS